MILHNVHQSGDTKSQKRRFAPTKRMLRYVEQSKVVMASADSASSPFTDIIRSSLSLLDVNNLQVLSLQDDGSFVCQAGVWNSSASSITIHPSNTISATEKCLQSVILGDTPRFFNANAAEISEEVARELHTRVEDYHYFIPIRLETEPIGVLGFGFSRPSEVSRISQLGPYWAEKTAHLMHKLGGDFSTGIFAAESVSALNRALDARDISTGDHSRQIANLTEQVAMRMGADFRQVHVIRRASLLHDIGKIGIPDKILQKPGPLDDHEWRIMRQHPEIGSRILQNSKTLKDVAELVLLHHERYDGSGYPFGLKGDKIPLGARILGVVDSFGAMTTNRIYRKARSVDEALNELDRCSGTLYDPKIVSVFKTLATTYLV